MEEVLNNMEPRHEKTCLCHMRTTKAQISLLVSVASLCGCAGRFECYLVENPEDRFSRDEAHIQCHERVGNTSFVFGTVLRKLILQTRMRSHPVELEV